MQRGKQTARQFKVLELLENSRYGLTLREIRDDVVDQLGLTSLHEKTIRRDITHWCHLGYPIEQHETANPDRSKIWQLDRSRRKVPRLPIGVVELLAFSAARELLYPLAGTPYWDGIQRLWERMRESTSPEILEHLDRQRTGLIVRGPAPRNYTRQEGMLSTLNRAIFEHRQVEIRYKGFGQSRFRLRTVAPHAVCLFDAHIYVLAADTSINVKKMPTESIIKTFKLDRISSVRLLDHRFIPMKDFDPAAHFDNSIGIFRNAKPKKFRIQISAEKAELGAEILQHPKQQLSKQKDGSLLIEIPAAYEEEILPRVLSLGKHAEVLIPKSCRNKLAAIARQLAKRYA